jgi:RNA polymerase sigma-70 factor (ECF subfamily)
MNATALRAVHSPREILFFRLWAAPVYGGDVHDSATTPPESTDEALMAEIQAGRQHAFEALVRRHQQPLLNFFRRLGVYTDGEDLVQETFVRLFRYRERYRPSAKFTTFLYTVARHVRIDLARKQGRLRLLQERVQQEFPAADDGGVAACQRGLDVDALLERLPEKLRSVVVLNIYQGLRYEEIARVLRIPEGTVKSRMFLALAKLREVTRDDQA